jgi:hypothetical protein
VGNRHDTQRFCAETAVDFCATRFSSIFTDFHSPRSHDAERQDGDERGCTQRSVCVHVCARARVLAAVHCTHVCAPRAPAINTYLREPTPRRCSRCPLHDKNKTENKSLRQSAAAMKKESPSYGRVRDSVRAARCRCSAVATRVKNERSDRSIISGVKTKTHDNGLENVVCWTKREPNCCRLSTSYSERGMRSSISIYLVRSCRLSPENKSFPCKTSLHSKRH